MNVLKRYQGVQASAAPSSSFGTEIRVGDAKTLPRRIHLRVEQESGRFRNVSILRVAQGGVNKWFALDSICYHAGGALANGELSVVNGDVCVKCPVHFFEISLATGFRVRAGNGKGKGPAAMQIPSGVVQRMHEAYERDGIVYLRIRDDGYVESDAYAFRKSFLGSALDW